MQNRAAIFSAEISHTVVLFLHAVLYCIVDLYAAVRYCESEETFGYNCFFLRPANRICRVITGTAKPTSKVLARPSTEAIPVCIIATWTDDYKSHHTLNFLGNV